MASFPALQGPLTWLGYIVWSATGAEGALVRCSRPVDPLAALALDRFERSRDPTHARLLPEIDLRQLFEANGLVLLRARYEREPRELEPYLDLAACEGDARARAEALAPSPYVAEVGWYLLEKR